MTTEKTPSDSLAIAEAYVSAVQYALVLVGDLRGLGKCEEDIAWRVMADRLMYPAHYRFTKQQLADLLAAALSLLASGGPTQGPSPSS